ncbi:MAG: HIT family protein [Candidatus Schekmanbacteria bacterium]|nr:HIT family protein [Candidatus Schekmanbacteria bacterium]
MDCIFCKIIQGQIPCQKLYEDEHVISFLDIYPAGPGHSLVLPKTHFDNLLEAESEVLGQIMQACQTVAKTLQAVLKADGFNIFLNNGQAAGQIIHHLHYHILPRFANDDLHIKLPSHKYQPGEMEQIQKDVSSDMVSPDKEQILSDLSKISPNQKLNCTQAFTLAQQYKISKKELGELLDQQQIKLRNCQFGCF